MRQLFTLLKTDLVQRLRDKSVIIFAVVVPLALMGAMNLVMGDAMDMDLDTATVAVSAPEGDQLAAALVQTLPEIGLDVEVTETSAADVQARAESGDAKLGLVIPEGFSTALMAGEPVEVEAIEGDGSGIETGVVLSVVQGFLDRAGASAVTTTAGAALGLPAADLGGLAQQVATGESAITLAQGQASDQQLDPKGALVAGQAGLFLMFTVSFGVLGLLAEREFGTLARLRSMPMNPMLVTLSKVLSSFCLGVVATSILLAAGSMLFGVDFGSPLPIAVLIISAVIATTSLTFIVIKLAKTTEQATVIQTILAMVLGIAGGAFFPMSGTGLLGTILDLNPVGAMIRGLGITSGGGGLADIGTPVLIMLGFAAVALVIARILPDRGAMA
ncbi:ABC transporter permease [Ornithinimicrobium faecis]|uniref:ABC transporter permease n=1 Tax=Ornithinimicrobium faecis TaxID=2934158 RepID=A0ABY4YY68_9MICO|nr:MULTISPECIES: ABC transporter permease [unclassified Ornithinimicrobium]USQ81731.1 ABC transporter permease [Ornithinimicrobium sp. HY1793]